MTRYNDLTYGTDFTNMAIGYNEGVDRVLEYVDSINAYPKLMAELKWAIDEGII